MTDIKEKIQQEAEKRYKALKPTEDGSMPRINWDMFQYRKKFTEGAEWLLSEIGKEKEGLKAEISGLQESLVFFGEKHETAQSQLSLPEGEAVKKDKEIEEWKQLVVDSLSGDENLVYLALVKVYLGEMLEDLQAVHQVLQLCEGKPCVETVGNIINVCKKMYRV